MKIFKYIVFISILSGIFFVIYRQSNEKGLRKLWISFKIAILIASVLAGLIPANTEAIEPPGNNTQVYQERLLSEQEFNSFEDKNVQVLLAKADGNPVTPSTNRGPSNFPTPPSGGRPSRPSRPVYVPKYRVAPKTVDQGLGAGANPAGAGGEGGSAEFDDQCPIPENQKSQESKVSEYDYRSKKKKQSAESCELDENVKERKIEIVYRIKENPALVREAQRAGRDQDAQRSLNNLVEQLALGNRNPGIGTENVFKDVYELRGKNRARVYYREVDGKIEILGKSVKSNQQKVINILKKMYD